MSQQLSRLSAILERFENVKIDLTPGSELYFNLSGHSEDAKAFFERYQDRILYGTDIGARNVIWKEPSPLSLEECWARAALITQFLETDGDYIKEADGYYIKEREPTLMHGLGLQKYLSDKIYGENFLDFIKYGRVNEET